MKKEAALCRQHLKEKAICQQDSKGCRSAREAAMIAKYFTNSRNPSNPKPLYTINALIPSKSQLASSQCTSKSISFCGVSLDIELLDGEPLIQSQNGSNNVPSEAVGAKVVAHDIHRQLRQDMV